MNQLEFDNEVRYRTSFSIFLQMFDKGWLTKKELTFLDRQLVEKYQPIIGSL